MCKYLIKRSICLFYKIKFFKRAVIKITSTILHKCAFEGQNRVGANNYLNDVSIGFFSCMGDRNNFYNTIIGRYCSIGSNVRLVSSVHPLETVSTSRVFYGHSGRGLSFQKNLKFKEAITDKEGHCLVIGNDVWIGDNVLIKGGVHIGDGAVIGMGTVITKDVPPYAIVAGNPARIIKYRFEDKIINDLQHINWWNWSIEKVRERAKAFSDPERFIADYFYDEVKR